MFRAIRLSVASIKLTSNGYNLIIGVLVTPVFELDYRNSWKSILHSNDVLYDPNSPKYSFSFFMNLKKNISFLDFVYLETCLLMIISKSH